MAAPTFMSPSSVVLGRSSTHESPQVSLNMVMSALHVSLANVSVQLELDRGGRAGGRGWGSNRKE
jgi:hypothetical protein